MTKARPDPPRSVLWITRTLEEAGHETWAVGGAVRDVLGGRPAGDWDLTTHATPDETQRLFRRTVPLGVEHGTVGILDRAGVMYEVTTFRRDVETDGRRAVVAFAETVEEDLARRDFTINAVAWHPLREELLDPYGGVEDLEAGRLRTVGDPGDRFREDYLRVLRAVRFASRFELEIEEATWTALRAATSGLQGLSSERIRDELLKILDADPRPSKALDLLAASGALEALFPELAARAAAEGWSTTLAVVDRLPAGNPLQRLTALLRGVPPREAAQLLLRLKLSNVQTDWVALRAGAPPLPPPDAPDAAFRRWLGALGPENLGGVARIHMAQARVEGTTEELVASWRRCRGVRAAAPPLTVGELAVDGRDLISLGLKPGPRFGEILEQLLDQVLEDPARNRQELLVEEARRLADEAPDGRESGA